MNTTDIHIERLQRFGQHLHNLEFIGAPYIEEAFVSMESNLKLYCLIKFNRVMLMELPKVFNEWEPHEFVLYNPRYIPLPDFSLSFCIREFFNLDVESFVHLFDCDEGQYQDTIQWGGTQLYENSTPKDYAFNISEYLKSIDSKK